jgi:hypothetical protein
MSAVSNEVHGSVIKGWWGRPKGYRPVFGPHAQDRKAHVWAARGVAVIMPFSQASRHCHPARGGAGNGAWAGKQASSQACGGYIQMARTRRLPGNRACWAPALLLVLLPAARCKTTSAAPLLYPEVQPHGTTIHKSAGRPIDAFECQERLRLAADHPAARHQRSRRARGSRRAARRGPAASGPRAATAAPSAAPCGIRAPSRRRCTHG